MGLVRHIVIYRLKDEFTPDQKRENAQRMKRELENLKGVIPGIIEFTVHIDALPSSDMDVAITSVFESESALAAYRTHPVHVKVAEFVHSIRQSRACFDYNE